MKAFLDTSSLVKLYHQEIGSEPILKTISSNIKSIILSEIAILEFRSAFWKKIRQKELSEETAVKVIECFENDYAKFQWIIVDSDLIHSASELLMHYGSKGLRTLDSLQLACALTLKDDDCIFLSSDSLLLNFFKNEKLKTE
jgi:uncharacterized protein